MHKNVSMPREMAGFWLVLKVAKWADVLMSYGIAFRKVAANELSPAFT